MRTGDPVRAVYFMRTQFVSYENTIREPAPERRAQFTIRSSHHRRVRPCFSFMAQGELEPQSSGATVIKRRTRQISKLRFRNQR
jgi:hypothetical protein